MVGAKVIPLRRGELVEGPSLAEEARDGELVDRARKGDRWAAGKLFERHHQQIYNLAFWMCSGSVEDAKDITQEAFLRAFKNLRGFRGDSSFYTWLCRIAINICLDNRRKTGRWRNLISFFSERSLSSREDQDSETGEGLGHSNDPSPLENLENKEFKDAMKKEFMALPEKQRLVFYLKVYQEMSVREISEVTGLAQGTVKTHLFRAMKAMRGSLNKWVRP